VQFFFFFRRGPRCCSSFFKRMSDPFFFRNHFSPRGHLASRDPSRTSPPRLVPFPLRFCLGFFFPRLKFLFPLVFLCFPGGKQSRSSRRSPWADPRGIQDILRAFFFPQKITGVWGAGPLPHGEWARHFPKSKPPPFLPRAGP